MLSTLIQKTIIIKDYPMRYVFILNPAAGKDSRALKMENRLKQSAENLGIDREIIISKSTEDIISACKSRGETGENHRIYALGGDGTLNRVVNGSYGYANIEIGVFPVGTGNDFIKATGISAEDYMDIEKQINGKSAPIDLIRYNGEICVNICNMGFDANTAMDMPKFRKLPFVSNHLAYYLSLLYNFLKKWGRYMEVYADGELLYNGDTMMCAVGNGISCGGGFYVTPAAKIDDGFIDVSAVSPPEKKKVFKFVGYYKEGTQLEHEDAMQYIHYKKCKKVYVKAPKPFAMVNDGDGKYITEACYEILPSAIKFIFPQ